MSRLPEHLDIHLIRILYLLLCEKNVSRVALKLNQPQPSISASLRKLRELTGDPLLVRGGRGMVPTQHGESLLKPAKRILDETESLFSPKTAFVPQEEARTFHIAAPDYMNTQFFTEVIARVRRESPKSRLVIHALGPDADYVRLLSDGELDLVVANWDEPPHHLRVGHTMGSSNSLEMCSILDASHNAADQTGSKNGVFATHVLEVTTGGRHSRNTDTWAQRIQAVHLHDEDAAQGRAVRHAQVQRGVADGAAQLGPVDHVAGNRVGVAQQLLGVREVAFGQRGAHRRRGDAGRALHHRGQGMDFEAVFVAGLDQHGHVASAPCAVAEVVAHHQPFHVQAVHQHVLGEFLRRERGEGIAEMLDDDAVDAVLLQRLQLVAQVGDAGRGLAQVAGLAREEFARVRFEGHHGGLDAQFIGRGAHLRQQRLVAEGARAAPVALDALAQAELEQGFQLDQAPLMRLVLVRTGEDTHHFIWTNHHLLTDGWSTSQLMGDVLRAYHGERLGPAPARYRDYIGWLQQRDNAASETWWRAQLARLDNPTRIAGAL
eukprot:gene26972-30491_t